MHGSWSLRLVLECGQALRHRLRLRHQIGYAGLDLLRIRVVVVVVVSPHVARVHQEHSLLAAQEKKKHHHTQQKTVCFVLVDRSWFRSVGGKKPRI